MGICGGLFDSIADGGRGKKLIAGVRYSLYLSDPGAKKRDCDNCDQRIRENSNCHNRKRYLRPIATDKERLLVPASVKPVQKIHTTSFYECPVSAITGKTWQIIGMVNELISAEGEILACAGKYDEIPLYLRDAIKIVRQERNRHRAEQMEKQRGK